METPKDDYDLGEGEEYLVNEGQATTHMTFIKLFPAIMQQ